MRITVPRVEDFEVTGEGNAPVWGDVPWMELGRVGEGASTYRTRGKVAYSATGLYVVVDCEDRQLCCTLTKDGSDIYTEDVVELFLWPDERYPVYLEYEISPLGVELPILVSNNGHGFHGWLAWHYEGDRQVRRATSVRGGPKASMAAVSGWTVEFCIPFALLRGMNGAPPASGATWRANLYRIDYDRKPSSQWAWCPDTGGNFHAYQKFGEWQFE